MYVFMWDSGKEISMKVLGKANYIAGCIIWDAAVSLSVVNEVRRLEFRDHWFVWFCCFKFSLSEEVDCNAVDGISYRLKGSYAVAVYEKVEGFFLD